MKNATFTIGQLVSFWQPTPFRGMKKYEEYKPERLPAPFRSMKKYEGYIAELPSDSDPYHQYTIKSFDGTYSPKQVGSRMIRKICVLGCDTYHELLAIN